MAIDLKYGRIILENGRHIPEDELVVVFRSQDVLLPKVLDFYLVQCTQAGSPPEHIALVERALDEVKNWQSVNPTKVPD